MLALSKLKCTAVRYEKKYNEEIKKAQQLTPRPSSPKAPSGSFAQLAKRSFSHATYEILQPWNCESTLTGWTFSHPTLCDESSKILISPYLPRSFPGNKLLQLIFVSPISQRTSIMLQSFGRTLKFDKRKGLRVEVMFYIWIGRPLRSGIGTWRGRRVGILGWILGKGRA